MTFGMIGGDRRQAELAKLLAADGNSVLTYGLESWEDGAASLERALEAETVILPLPLCKGDGVLNCEAPIPTAELFRKLSSKQRIFAGQIKEAQRREAVACGLVVEDYFLLEEVTVANAAATAEGALRIVMEHRDRAILGSECLVLGFGRIGKLLCHRLQGLGARVTAAARKREDLAWIRAYGWRALDINAMDGDLGRFEIVLNTVPALILDRSRLLQLSGSCLCVELASQQGMDLAAAEDLGLSCVWARSLPGRFVPQTAASVIRDAIYYMLLKECPA